jgi:glycosyltransferase involved in cell wall biosynthesis
MKQVLITSISVIIPALNEEGNIEAALNNVIGAVEKSFTDYEVIVVNDGSTDTTLAIVQKKIEANPRIRLIHHPYPRNIGICYSEGRNCARMEYCVMIQGDNVFSEETLIQVFSQVGKADFICTYWNNPEIRSWTRRLISAGYTGVLNFMLKENLRYYNGMQIHRTDWLKQVEITSVGFGYQAEVLVHALKQGKKYLQIPVDCMERPGGGMTKVFKPQNIKSVMQTILHLYAIHQSYQNKLIDDTSGKGEGK